MANAVPLPHRGSVHPGVLLGLLTLCFTLSYIDRQLISLLVAPIKLSLGLSDTQLGLMQGVSFSLFYVTASLPLAWLADRGDRCRLIAACVALWSVMTMLCGAASSFLQLFLARIGVAVGEAGLPPAGLSMMADRFDARLLPVSTSLFMLAPFIGGGLALTLGGALYGASASWALPVLPWIGVPERWQAVFMLIGAPGVLVAAAVLVLLRDQRPGVAPSLAGDTAHGLLSFLRGRGRFVLVYILCIALTSLQLSTYSAWLPAALMRAYAVDERQLGLLFGPVFLGCGGLGTLMAGVGLTLLGGRDPLHTTLRLMRWCVGLLLPLAVIGPLMPTLGLAMATMGASLFLIGAVIGQSSLPLQFIAPARLRARLIALMGLLSALIGTGLGPLAAGLLSDSLVAAPRPLSAALCLIAGVCLPVVIGGLAWVTRQVMRTSAGEGMPSLSAPISI